jgi:peptide chain release factor 2
MADEAADAELIADLARKADGWGERVRILSRRTLFTGPHDARNAFLSIHAGAGGTDACDWAEMLLRMYTRFLERSGFRIAVLDLLEGEEAGLRRVQLHVVGPYAFGTLRGERGVHRLVRISPFDANQRRHTSFASVDVVPEEEDIEIEIRESDLRIDTFSAGGPGGQHVNKTQSAVRIIHLPTGITAQCQNERSQMLNRRMAMKILMAKLRQHEEARRDAELARMYGERGEISFGYQIRSYVLQPYTMVKDHRTGVETGNVQAVLDGDLEPFIEAYLRAGEPHAGGAAGVS